MTVTQLAVMRCISRRDGEPLAHVAHELELDRTSLYRAINPMVRDGWLAPVDGADARSRSAKITKKGARLLAKAGKGWGKVQNRLIEGFGADKYQALVSEFHRFAECAEALKADLRRDE